MTIAASSESMVAPLAALATGGMPVLRATAQELTRMANDQERVSASALATAILRDPLMTLQVLRFLQSHRTRSQTMDITTIAHAIMMLGQARFFREFDALPALEDRLRAMPQALDSLRATMSRMRLASLIARDLAVQRHDMDPEEVQVAALMHDVAELLMLLAWPEPPPEIAPDAHCGIRAQLFARLHLPGLLTELTDDGETLDRPRMVNVRYACVLARHCAHGWDHPLLERDLEDIQRFLHVSAAEVWERVRRVALQAAREWRFYEVRPAAAYFVQLPQSAPAG